MVEWYQCWRDKMRLPLERILTISAQEYVDCARASLADYVLVRSFLKSQETK